MRTSCLPPIFLDRVLDEPGRVRELVERHSPYYPVQRYFESGAEYRASSGTGPMIVAPNFRGEWAYDRPLVEGADLFLEHFEFARTAARLFGTQVVHPQIVYTNLTWQLPFDQGGGHTDVPAFRGVDRGRYPIWLLGLMGHSGLFEDERIRIATAVAWFYRGPDGGFTYWPDGPDRPPLVHEGDIFNTACVGDNDRMFHRVRPVGRRRDGLLGGMTLDTRLEHQGGDAWVIADGERELARLDYDALRISVSWKAQVFRDTRELRMIDENEQDIDLDEVVRRFRADLDDQGIACEAPRDPLRDPEWVETLTRAYRREPSVFDEPAREVG